MLYIYFLLIVISSFSLNYCDEIVATFDGYGPLRMVATREVGAGRSLKSRLQQQQVEILPIASQIVPHSESIGAFWLQSPRDSPATHTILGKQVSPPIRHYQGSSVTEVVLARPPRALEGEVKGVIASRGEIKARNASTRLAQG